MLAYVIICIDGNLDVRLLVLRTVAVLVNDAPGAITDDLYNLLKERSRDKSLPIRKEAATAMASVYKHLIKQEQPPVDRISLALNTILHMYYHPSVDDRIVVERLFKSSLVPYHFDTAERVRALFTCYSLMDEASVRAMQEMFKIQFTVLSLVRDVLQLLSTQEGKTISSQLGVDLMDRLHHLSNMLPKSDKCVEHLKRFFNQVHTDKSLRSQLIKLTKPGCTCSHATNIMRDLLKRVDSSSTSGSGSSSEAHLAYVRSVKILLERSAPVLFDKDFGQELLTQLVVVREAGTVFGIIGTMDITRALRLLYSLAVYFKRVLPTDEVMDYLVGILSGNTEPNFEPITVSGPEEPSSTANDSDPPTVQELALNILCCLLGNSNLMFEADSLSQYRSLSRVADTHFNGSEPNLQERVSDFLPLLQRLCCTGMTLRFPALPCSPTSHPLSASCSGRPANTKGNRGGTKRAVEQRSTPPPTSENDKLGDDVYLAGLAWRRERRRAKLATQVVLCMLKVAQRFRQNSTKSHSPPPVAAVRAPSPVKRDDVDLDAEGTKCGGTVKNDTTTEPSVLELKIREAVDSIVQTCLACPMDSPDYVACLTSLSRIALQFPGVYNREFKKLMTKSLVQHVLTRDTDTDNSLNSATADSENSTDKKQTSKTTKMSTVGNLSPVAAADWLPDGYIPQATRAKLSAIKLMTNWLRGLKNEVKPVAQAVIRLLHRIIIHDGDLNRQRKLMPGEMSRMRLIAAVSWLKLAYSQAYVESIEVDWYQSMTYIICDPCPHVRSHFLTKLNQGLYRLRLPLEYIAIFAHAVDVPDPAFKQRAKQLLIGNIQRRRDFLDRHASYRNDTKFLYGLLPDFVLPYLIYLLAHDPEWADISDANRLNRIKTSLWFVMEPIVSRGHNFVFLRKIIEKIKHTRDALAPDDPIANTKLYVVCDIALGLLLTRVSDLTMKEYPADVKLPKTLFLATPASFKNPDFAQLLDPAVNAPAKEAGKEQTMTVKPLIQFTPSKSGRAIKEGWMPAELLKEKHSVPKVPKNASPVTKESNSSALEANAVQLTASKVSRARRKVATKQIKLNVSMPSPKESLLVTPEEETSQQESESLSAGQNTPRKYTRIVLGRPEIESDNTNSPISQRKRSHPISVTPSKRRKLFTSSDNSNKSKSEKILSVKSKISTSIPTASVKSRTSKTVTKIRRTVTKTVTLARGRSATKLQLMNGCGTSKSPKKPLLSVSTSLTKRSSIVSAVISSPPAGHTGRTRGRPPKSLSKPQTKLTRSRSSLSQSQSRLPTNKDRKRLVLVL
ncbi:sister chromatid cohesion protein PDS5 [Paragonimus westermani]|uniref:Sister chromatid cohesion protein PDS5 n=1 Tax=Paragonimus westermani TaxID=34504 RepID=A0A5J4NQE0_9TREM|nr:sister chromatid cohesion protein PDS5 [Paragonimus westermani]